MAEFEYIVKTLPIDAALEAEIKALANNGWNLVPGAAPVAVYHLVREKQSPAGNALGRLIIDDSLVSILRNGESIPA